MSKTVIYNIGILLIIIGSCVGIATVLMLIANFISWDFHNIPSVFRSGVVSVVFLIFGFYCRERIDDE